MNRSFGRRRPPQRPDPRVESDLRASLRSHADRTPDADRLTRRILETLDDAPSPLRVPAGAGAGAGAGSWRVWGLPLVAAASVAVVVGAGVAMAAYHPGRHADQAATRRPGPTPTVQPMSSSSGPTHRHDLGGRSSRARPSSITPMDTSSLRDVKVLDLTFTDDQAGFALASARCLTTAGRCTALLQTTDGEHWRSHPHTPFDVAGISAGCPASRCVSHIRFATSEIGYVYGPDALFMTTNGAASWQQLSAGADALETLDGNVVRVVASTIGCAAEPCPAYQVETAAPGSDDWTTRALPGDIQIPSTVVLSRGGADAYLLITSRPSSDGARETSKLLRSTDDGRTWDKVGDPCRSSGSVGYSVAAGTDGSVTELCRDRTDGSWFVTVSENTGTTFQTRDGRVTNGVTTDPGAQPSVLAGDPQTVLAAAGNGLSLSRDGGGSWSSATGPTGSLDFVGFESATVGRALTANGRHIWTTHDAGRSWTRANP